jgi:hypothetical protein
VRLSSAAARAMKHASLNQILLRILLVVYVFRLLPVTQYLLRGQLALKSALGTRAPPVAFGGPRSVVAAALDVAGGAAAATAVDLACRMHWLTRNYIFIIRPAQVTTY